MRFKSSHLMAYLMESLTAGRLDLLSTVQRYSLSASFLLLGDL